MEVRAPHPVPSYRRLGPPPSETALAVLLTTGFAAVLLSVVSALNAAGAGLAQSSWTLLLIGTAVLASTTHPYFSGPTRRISAARPTASPRGGRYRAPWIDPSVGPAHRLTAPSLSLRPAAPAVGLLAATVPSPTGPGERLWSHLVPDPAGELPVELVGPVRESAFDLEADLQVATTPALDDPVGPAPGAAPTGWGSSSFDGFGVGGHGGGSDWLAMEAMMVTPPHLRRVAVESVRSSTTMPVGGNEITVGTGCANCSTGLSDPEGWHRCTRCRRPMCLDCLLETLKSQGRGWCSTCAGSDDTIELPEAN